MSADKGNQLLESKIVCPHCWHGFYADEAIYISRHRELYGDDVLGPNEQRRFSPKDVRQDRHGNALDPKGWKMVERACPRCHLQIPPDLLAKRPYFVSIVGAPRSGKTYFLTSMLHGLRKDLARYFGFSLVDSDSHAVTTFLEYERALFFPSDASRPTQLKKTDEVGDLYNTVTLDGVQVQLPKPFVFSLLPTQSHVDSSKMGNLLSHSIVLYDNAGESFDFLKERDGRNQVTQHLAECDAVLFALDPLQDPDARQRLVAVSNDPQLTTAASSYRQETILSEVVNRIRRHRRISPGRRLDVTLAVCVQKYDVWHTLVPYGTVRDGDVGERHIIDDTSVEYFSAKGVAGLDVEEINTISLLVRSFVDDLCPEFVAMADANFGVVRYFPVSALGTSPNFSQDPKSSDAKFLSVRPIDLRPFRVTHAMLWLLYKWKLLRGVVRAGRAQRYPHAKVENVTEDRIRFITPGSGRIISLDRYYAGSCIVDPFSGEKIWIPDVTKEAAELQSPPVPTAVPRTEPDSSLKLKLDEPPRPSRRGWFRK